MNYPPCWFSTWSSPLRSARPDFISTFIHEVAVGKVANLQEPICILCSLVCLFVLFISTRIKNTCFQPLGCFSASPYIQIFIATKKKKKFNTKKKKKKKKKKS